MRKKAKKEKKNPISDTISTQEQRELRIEYFFFLSLKETTTITEKNSIFLGKFSGKINFSRIIIDFKEIFFQIIIKIQFVFIFPIKKTSLSVLDKQKQKKTKNIEIFPPKIQSRCLCVWCVNRINPKGFTLGFCFRFVVVSYKYSFFWDFLVLIQWWWLD